MLKFISSIIRKGMPICYLCTIVLYLAQYTANILQCGTVPKPPPWENRKSAYERADILTIKVHNIVEFPFTDINFILDVFLFN